MRRYARGTSVRLVLITLHRKPKIYAWQILTHMFMHGDIMHIFFNMFGLWMFGTPLEQMWGRNKFIFFYISTGLGAAALQMLLYYFQVEAVASEVLRLGGDATDVRQLFNFGELPQYIADQIATETLQSSYASFNAVFSGCLWGFIWGFGGLCHVVSQCTTDALVSSHSHTGEIFGAFTHFSRCIFWIYKILCGAHCALCPRWRGINRLVMMWYWKRTQFRNNRWN